MKKIAVVFPGIGYHVDKPLLYYSSRIARQKGYVVCPISYTDLALDLAGAKESLEETIKKAEEGCWKQVVDLGLEKGDEIVFLSKSIGTVLALFCAKEVQLSCRHVLYTPLVEAFRFPVGSAAMAFSGTRDPWADHERIRSLCYEHEVPLISFDEANHSLETGDVLGNLHILQQVMEETNRFLD